MKLLTDVVVWLFLAENLGLLILVRLGWKMFKSPAGSLLGAAAVTDLALGGQRGVKGMSDMLHDFKAPGE